MTSEFEPQRRRGHREDEESRRKLEDAGGCGHLVRRASFSPLCALCASVVQTLLHDPIEGSPMNRYLHGVARALAETFDLPGPVLEIGSYQVPGQEAIADLRPLFPDKPFTGLDARPGPGVDLVADVECLPYPDASVGTVVALSTFEHV